MSTLRTVSSLRTMFSSPLSRLVTSVAVIGSLSTAASAEAVRVAPAPAPHVIRVDGVPAHFAQPPHAVRARPAPDADMDIEPVLDRASVRAALAAARQKNLAAFRAYQKLGVFPSNIYQPNQLNVWHDQDGHFCAAATIIRMSGQIALVDRVAEQNNFIRLADVKQGPLMDWILTSGFTQEDIVAIQKPFMPVVEKPVPAPQQPMVVDAKLRAAETARLTAVYKRVDHMLVVNEKRDLDLAVDRLMKHPDLAENLLAATSEPASIPSRRD